MSGRESAPNVTLFPFLAVLVCTMGALILLLVVTTRRIRQQAIARAEEEARVTAAPAPADLPISPLFAEEDLATPVISDERQSPIEPAPLPPDLTREAKIQQMIADRDAEAARLRREWQSRIDELIRRRQALVSSLHQNQQIVEQTLAAVDRMREQLGRYSAASRQAAEQQILTRQRLSELTALNAELTARMKEVEEELEQLQSAPPADPKVEFIARDVTTGTDRRPILIECREDGILFPAEDVFISAEQLNGFGPESNPLLAGTQALIDYWSRYDGPGEERPYVLLVVRAKGTIGFYVARKLLQSLKEPYGYELIEDDREVKWPESNPGAVEACRRAVELSVANRPDVPGSGYGRSYLADESVEFSDEQGHFRMAEVDQLREPQDKVYFGGQTFSRPRRTSPSADRSDMRSGEGTSPSLAPRTVTRDSQSKTGLRPNETPAPGNGTPEPSFAPEKSSSSSESSVVHALQQAQQRSAVSAIENPFDAGFQPPPARSSSPFDATPPFGQSTPGNGSSLLDDGGENRRWGMANRGGTIGIEREVTIDLRSSSIVIDGTLEMKIPQGAGRAELQQMVAQALDVEARTWGTPPTGFCWRPTAQVIVHPGGNTHLARLAELFKHWGLKWQAEQCLD